MYKLIIEDDEGKTTTVPLIRNQIVIGRDDGNTVRLTERNVSRRHARLRIENGHIFVEDLQSYNGSWVNGDRVEGEFEVRPGDLLVIGDYHLTLESDEGGATDDAMPSLPPRGQQITPPTGVPLVTPSGELQPARLQILNTSFSGQEFSLNKDEVLIGRTDENDIGIDHPSVSRHHARIVKQVDTYQIVDLESANGVCVNGEDYSICDLRWGDIIELGHVRIRFVAPLESENVVVNFDDAAAAPGMNGDTIEITQLDAIEAISPPSRTNPALFVGIGGFVLLLVGGLFWVIGSTPPGSSNKKPQKRISEPTFSSDEQIKQAQQSLKNYEFGNAIAILNEILRQNPQQTEALALKKHALVLQKEHGLLRKATTQQASEKWKDALETLSKLGTASPFYEKARADKKSILDLLAKKVAKLDGEEKYNEALQYNSLIMEHAPDDEEAKKRRDALEAKMNPTPRVAPVPRPDIRIRPAPFRIRKKPMRRRVRRRIVRKRPLIRRRVKPPVRSVDMSQKCLNHFKKSRLLSATTCYRRLVKKEPKHAAGHYMLGVLFSRRGHCNNPEHEKYKPSLCTEASIHYRKYVKLEPHTKRAATLRKMLK